MATVGIVDDDESLDALRWKPRTGVDVTEAQDRGLVEGQRNRQRPAAGGLESDPVAAGVLEANRDRVLSIDDTDRQQKTEDPRPEQR